MYQKSKLTDSTTQEADLQYELGMIQDTGNLSQQVNLVEELK